MHRRRGPLRSTAVLRPRRRRTDRAAAAVDGRVRKREHWLCPLRITADAIVNVGRKRTREDGVRACSEMVFDLMRNPKESTRLQHNNVGNRG